VLLQCSRHLSDVLYKLQDERFWHAQQPHYGTTAAKQLLQAASQQLPALPSHSLQLPSVRLPSPQFSAPQLPHIAAAVDGQLLQDSIARLTEVRSMPSRVVMSTSPAAPKQGRWAVFGWYLSSAVLENLHLRPADGAHQRGQCS
jgi:hypothetical protein